MRSPFMPKATALWLIENTSLTFKQIADFCQLHAIEIQAIADGEVDPCLKPFDPVANNQLSTSNIEDCMKDPSACLILIEPISDTKKKSSGHKYMPLSKRKERPDAIAWLIKNHPELSDQHIITLLNTTKTTIDLIRHKTHWNAQNIKPRNPILMGLCSQDNLDEAINKTKK